MNAKFLPFALAALLSAPAFAQDYAIKLHRPEKPGDEYRTATIARDSRTIEVTIDGVLQKDRSEKVNRVAQFDGMVKVIAVDEKGSATKIILTVNRFMLTSNGNTGEVFPGGTAITVSMSGKKQTSEVDGESVSTEAEEAVNMIVTLSKGGPTDDELFGTTERKRKGDSWKIDGEKVAKNFQRDAERLEISNLTGKVTLTDVTKDLLTVTLRLAGNVKLPLPPMFIIDESSMAGTMSSTLPVDNDTNPSTSDNFELSFALTAHARSPSDQNIVMKINITSRQESADQR